MDVIVENRWQARKVRVVLWAMALWCAGWLYWAYDLAHTYGLSPGDGGVLRPAGERFMAAAVVAALGIAPFAGMAFYARRYVTRLARDGDTITVSVLGIVSTATWSRPVAAVSSAKEHQGRLELQSSVNAPWITLRIDGRRYVIDLQSEHVNRNALNALVRAGRRARGR
jgi:hypothetical protein